MKKKTFFYLKRRIEDWGFSSSYRYITPLIYTGTNPSKGGREDAARMCKLLRMRLVLYPPRAVYEHVWGPSMHSRRILDMHGKTLFFLDVNRLVKTSPLDPIKGSSTLIIRVDSNKLGNTTNMGKEKKMEFKRPKDKKRGKLIANIDQDRQGDEKLWVESAPKGKWIVITVMGNINKWPDLNIVKKMHRYTNGNSNKLSRLFEEAGMLTPWIGQRITKVTESCILRCKSLLPLSGSPTNAMKCSLKHVNRELNNEVQADFMTIKHNGDNYNVLNISNCSTAFGERSIVKSRSAEEMMETWHAEFRVCAEMNRADIFENSRFRELSKFDGVLHQDVHIRCHLIRHESSEPKTYTELHAERRWRYLRVLQTHEQVLQRGVNDSQNNKD